MDWQAVQALGELVAAVGVIISLLYLAAQVRQNTKSVQGAANQDLLTSFREITQFSSESPFGARLLHATLRGSWSELSPEEQSAARITWMASLRLFDHAFMQHKAGLLGDDAWAGWAYQIRLTAGLKGFQDVWPGISAMLSQSFVAWIDDLGEEANQTVAEYQHRLGEAGQSVYTLRDDSGSAPPP